MSTHLLLHKAALRRVVRDVPAEKDLNIDDFAITHGKNLGVLEASTRVLPGGISDEDVVSVGYEVFIFES
jgi:hypothetical protein